MGFEDCPLEICENVLLYLDVRTLLLSRRVCQRWADLIRFSSAIQQALFFQPAASQLHQGPQMNPLLAAQFPPWFPEDNEDACAKAFSVLDMHKFFKSRERYLHPNASWRRMLIQQPPAMSLSWVERNDLQTLASVDRWAISAKDIEGDESGIRMRTLYDLVMCPFWLEQKKTYFHFRVCWPQNSRGPDGLQSSPPIPVPRLPWYRLHTYPLGTALRESDIVLDVWDVHGDRFPRSRARYVKDKRDIEWDSLERFVLPFKDSKLDRIFEKVVFKEGSKQVYFDVNIQPIPDSDDQDL